MAAREPVRFVGGFDELTRAIRKLKSPSLKAQVNSAYDKGLGYAWGRLDAERTVRRNHSMDSMGFATSYATHVLSGLVNGHITHDIRTCWERWIKDGVI